MLFFAITGKSLVKKTFDRPFTQNESKNHTFYY